MLGHLLDGLALYPLQETAGQRVPDELMALAMQVSDFSPQLSLATADYFPLQNTWFRKIRSKHGRQGSQRAGGGGAHRKERPGLGATPGAGGGRARRKERPGLGATPGVGLSLCWLHFPLSPPVCLLLDPLPPSLCHAHCHTPRCGPNGS